MAAFATTAELATFTGDTSLDGPRGTLLTEQASAAIRTYCRQTFDLVADEAELRGTWSQRLLLPERPVVSVASVAIDGTDIADAYTRVRDVLYRTSNWGGPGVVVTVVYTHGFAADAPAMDTLKGVCLQVAARAAQNPRAMTQESIGDWSGSYANGGGGFALTAAEQAILDRFRHEYAS